MNRDTSPQETDFQLNIISIRLNRNAVYAIWFDWLNTTKDYSATAANKYIGSFHFIRNLKSVFRLAKMIMPSFGHKQKINNRRKYGE